MPVILMVSKKPINSRTTQPKQFIDYYGGHSLEVRNTIETKDFTKETLNMIESIKL